MLLLVCTNSPSSSTEAEEKGKKMKV